ncbi:DUF2997 domain-containing protein [Tenacibaculum sp. 190524A05c]|uniref:DUF2997 domain-containing protein n=1 Tax=Tenacibaculum platacis TaxID=3137852 RepID=UPI0032B0F6BB
MKKIIIEITNSGAVKAKVEGVKGKRCLEYISVLEDLIEGETLEHELTHEFHENEIEVNKENKLSNNSK